MQIPVLQAHPRSCGECCCFVMFVRLPVRLRGKLCSHWKDIYQIWCWGYLLKYAEKIVGWLQLNKIAGTLHEDLSTFMILCR